MKALRTSALHNMLIFMLLFLTLIVTPITVNAQPDLIIDTMEVLLDPYIRDSNPIVPIHVTVKNVGNTTADPFKLSAHFLDHTGLYVVAFTAGSDLWYPRIASPLSPGESVPFIGELIFHPSRRGTNVKIWTLADSCSGEEFVPADCRVAEKNEDNNWSAGIGVLLPKTK